MLLMTENDLVSLKSLILFQPDSFEQTEPEEVFVSLINCNEV